MKLKIFTITLSALIMNLTMAAPLDVYGEGDKFIKVTRYDDIQKIRFELCLKYNTEVCNQIGSKVLYDISKIEALRTGQNWEVAAAAGLDIVAVVFTWYAGAIIGVASVGNIYLANSIPASLAGGVTGLVLGGGTAIYSINSLNPWEQYKQLETISPAVLADSNVFTSTNSDTFAQRLAVVLDSLN